MLAARAVVRHFPARTVLIHEGDRGDTLFIVRSGRVRAYCSDAEGRQVTLGIHGAGELIGEMSLDGGPRSATVETMEPSICAVVARHTLLDYLRDEPDFALELISLVIRRARAATDATRNFALTDIYARLALLLGQLAGEVQADGSRVITQRITHQQIAHHLACSREMVSRLMKDLERGGYVATRDRRIVLQKALPARW